MRRASRPAGEQGFSLIELMVGIVIGMIAIIVIAQVFQLSEGFRRNTTGGDDATNSGAIALIGLQRDIRQSGYGISHPDLLGCTLTMPAPATWNVTNLAPVTINHPTIPAGDANTDTLLIVYGNANGLPEGDRVLAQNIVNVYTVTSPAAYVNNDVVVGLTQTPPVPCVLRGERVTMQASPPAVGVPLGTAGMTSGRLFSLGQAPRALAYAVRGGNLTLCDFLVNDCSQAGDVDDETVWTPIASNIVSLRAQYGHDTTSPMDAVVDAYDRTTPAPLITPYTIGCAWLRVSAVRIALVARNGELQRADGRPVAERPTPAAPAWAASAAAPIDLSADPNWQWYRYRVFETTVPMRNLSWQARPLLCP